MSIQLFVKPYDIFMPRGNSHFGVSSGDFGQVNMLPAPSIFAGAFRSFIASRNPEVLKAIMNGECPKEDKYGKVLGSLEEPGSFRIGRVVLVKQERDNVETFFPLPSDVTVFNSEESCDICYLSPCDNIPFISINTMLPKVALLKGANKKPSTGFWLREKGYKKYLNKQPLGKEDLIKESELWQKEMRVGITLDKNTRSAQEGMLYTAEALSFKENIGFLLQLQGTDNLLNEGGDISLGGDQRAANFYKINVDLPEADYISINQLKKFKIVLTSPAIFTNGWLPDCIEQVGQDYFLKLSGVKAKLVCATIKGYETLSGWNMVDNKPKVAIRTVPAGSVYWFEELEGDINIIKNHMQTGQWHKMSDKQRIVEGYNQAILAAY